MNTTTCKLLKYFALLAYLPVIYADTGVPIEVELVWGRGPEAAWDGELIVDNARITAVKTPLLQPGESARIESDKRLSWVSRTSGAVDGVTVTLEATENTHLHIKTPHGKWDVSLGELEHGEKRWGVGRHWIGARLPSRNFARLASARDSLVFTTSEQWDMTWDLFPGFSREGGKTRYCVGVQDDRTGASLADLASGHIELRYGERIRKVDRIQFPGKEGVYSLFLRIDCENEALPGSRIQVVVLDERKAKGAARPPRVVQELDVSRSANKDFFRDDSQSNLVELGGSTYRQSGQRAERSNRKVDDRDLSWFAYRLDIERPGKNHMLEFSYPKNKNRRFLVSVLEEPDAGRRTSGLNQGTVVHASADGESGIRRIIFWPTTHKPVITFINTLPGSSAAVRDIRIYEFPDGLPLNESPADRKVGPYFEEAHIPRELGGRMVADPGWLGGADLRHDWITFYDAITNLAQMVRHRGENTVALTVFTYGASLYPSSLLPNNERYDNGLQFVDGRDPVQKDVVRLILDIFERYDVTLIPVFAFYSTLPSLENAFKPDSKGLREVDLVHRSGNALRNHVRLAGSVEAGPYYNPLNPDAQGAVADVLREFTSRYSDSQALGDVAIQLNTTGWTQFPGMEWGYDYATVRRFVEQRRIDGISETQLGNPEYMYTLLNSTRMYESWRDWRNLEIKRFYETLASVVGQAGDDRKLVLAYMNTYTSRFSDDNPIKAWEGRMTPREMLARKGVDPMVLATADNVRIWRPLRTPVPFEPRQQRFTRISQSPASAELFREAGADGTLNFHNYYESRIPSLENNWWWDADVRLVGTIVDPEATGLGEWYKDKDYFYGGWQIVQ